MVTGDLNFPLNKEILRWDGVFYKIFEKETILNITNGNVTKITEVDNYIDDPNAINRKYKDQGKLSSLFFNKIKKIKWKDFGDCDCSDKYVFTIDSEGKVSNVSLTDQLDNEKEYVLDEEEHLCIEAIYNAVKKLKFDIVKNKGIPIQENLLLEIWIDEGKIENWTN